MNVRFNPFPGKTTENSTAGSRPEIITGRFKQWLLDNPIDAESVTTEDSIKDLIKQSKTLGMGVKADEVIAELKKSGLITEPVVEKTKEKTTKAPEEISLKQKVDFSEFKVVESDEIKKQLEENKFFEEIKKDVFKNDKDLETTYQQALSLEKKGLDETIESYYAFAEAGLIKGGRQEVEKDLQALQERKDQFKKNTESLEKPKAAKVEKNKKIAAIVERSVAYCVTELGWYGSNVTIEPTSQFDDVKRRVDEVLQIKNKNTESSFMGLGIDVTYRGLLSEQFREKLFVLLDSIRDGYKTKIKYFKNSEGKMMPEFAVPKIILYFNVGDVKDLAYLVKNVNDPKTRETFKNSFLKNEVLNQILVQCELLAEFAESYNNDISIGYREIISSISELAQDNPELQEMLDNRHTDDVAIHMKYLIKEYREMQG